VFFQWINITNEARYNYPEVGSRLLDYNVTESSFDLGLKWSL